MFTKKYISSSLVAVAARCALTEADVKVQVKHKKEKIKLLKKQLKDLKRIALESSKDHAAKKDKLDKEESSLVDLRSAVESAYEKLQKANEEEKIVNDEVLSLLGDLERLDPKAKKEAEEMEVEEAKDEESEEEKEEEKVEEGSKEHEDAESAEVEKAEEDAEEKKE